MGGGGGGSYSRDQYKRLAEVARQKLEREASGSPHIFISFDHENLDEVNLLRGQAQNVHSRLQFDDFSVKEPFDSVNADYIKRQISARIERTSVTVVYLTDQAASSRWVAWEIEESIRQGKGVVGVYREGAPPKELPAALTKAKAPVVPWKQAELQAAIEKASANRI